MSKDNKTSILTATKEEQRQDIAKWMSTPAKELRAIADEEREKWVASLPPEQQASIREFNAKVAGMIPEPVAELAELNKPLHPVIEARWDKHKDHFEMLDHHLTQLHKYECTSDRPHAPWGRLNLPAIPHQEIYGKAVYGPADLTPKQQTKFRDAEYKKRGGTPKKWKEYSDARKKRSKVQLENQSDQAFGIAESIRDVIATSPCLRCGESHTDEDGEFGYNYDVVMRELFTMAACELLSRKLWNDPRKLIGWVKEIAVDLESSEAESKGELA